MRYLPISVSQNQRKSQIFNLKKRNCLLINKKYPLKLVIYRDFPPLCFHTNIKMKFNGKTMKSLDIFGKINNLAIERKDF